MDTAWHAETETLRRVKSARRDEHGRQADEGMEQGDELRHRRHLNGAGPPNTDGAAYCYGEQDPQKRRESPRQLIEEGCRRRYPHADHAEPVAVPGCLGRG